MLKKIKHWLLLAIVTTASCGLVYTSVQQVLRSGADDPQIQMAQDTALELSRGQKPETLVPAIKVDIAQSLATFVVIFDENGKALTSSAILNGATPEVPEGVFDFAGQYGENRFTWEPSQGIRQASVVVPYESEDSKGFVLVGRSLKEIEERENRLVVQIGVVWVLTLLTTAGVIYLFPKGKPKA